MPPVPPPTLVPGLEEFWAPAGDTPESLEKEIEKPPRFAPGRAATAPWGVVYNGPWETLHDGVCVAVRRNACALRRAGLPVFLSSLTHTHWNNGYVDKAFHHELPPEVLNEVDHLTDCDHRRTIARILHFVPTTDFLAQQDRPVTSDADLKDVLLTRTIAYMALEYDKFPSYWVHVFNKLGRILVPCRRNAIDLANAGVTIAIDVVPHPMALNDPMRKVNARNTGGEVRFLHVGKWEPRKNQHALIGGFLTAFSPGSATLTLHCKPFWGAPPYPRTPEESRAMWLEDEAIAAKGWTPETYAKHVRVSWAKMFTREQMVRMYGQHHVYVSSARAEGFDLCAFDAKVANLLMVHVGFGGPEDFCTSSDVLIRYANSSPPPKQYRAPEGAVWPDPTRHDYARSLLEAYHTIRSEAPIERLDLSPFKIDSVGAKLRASVQALAADHDIKLDEAAP